MLVLDSLVPGVDLILGDSWMKLHKCTLNYDRGQALLWRDGKLHALRMEPEAPQPSAPQARSAAVATLAAAVGMPLLLTRHQAQRVMRKQQRSFLVVVKAVSAQETAMRKRTAAGTLMCAPKCCTAATAPPVEGLVPDKDLQALLAEYPDVTGPLTGPSKLTAPVEVVEQLPGSKPTWRPPFRLSAAEKATVEEQVKDLLAKGFIRPSSSPFGAPVLFVPKPDGSLRLCLDYRLLNATCSIHRSPIPRVDDLMDSLEHYGHQPDLI
jgi:hypothetical protein